MIMAAPEDLKNILGPNEKVELYIKEKIYHPQLNIDSVIITNGRVILRHPHALGLKKDYTDYSYQDITNVVLDKGIMRSTIKLTIKRDEKLLELDKLPNLLAEKAYGIIRENLSRFQAPFSTGYANAPPFQQGSAPTGVPSAGEGQRPPEERKQ
jgi:hypothetical protein